MIRIRLYLLCLAAANLGWSAPFTNLYFFGDSLSDAGNISRLTLGVYPPAPYAGGRFSNGPVWAEVFSSLRGFPNAGLPAGMTLGPNFFNLEIEGPGNNFAIGGARTGTGGALDGIGIPTGMLTQTMYYLSEMNGVAESGALHVLFGGGNDLRDAAQLSGQARIEAANTAAYQVAVSLYLLLQGGAREFLVLNAPDIGLTPEARLVRNNAAAATEATIQFNAALDYFLNFFSGGGIRIQRFNTFSLFQAVYVDALGGGSLTGITNASMPCFAGFAGSMGGDCSKSIFADDIHPTARVHGLLGYLVHQQVTENPEPGTVLLLGSALGILMIWRRRHVGSASSQSR
jgi:outer membrane lipase/esterase